MNLCCVDSAERVRGDYGKRIGELEGAMQRFVDRTDRVKYRDTPAFVLVHYENFKSLLSEENE